MITCPVCEVRFPYEAAFTSPVDQRTLFCSVDCWEDDSGDHLDQYFTQKAEAAHRLRHKMKWAD